MRVVLAELIKKHAGVVKKPAFKYVGPAVGPVANEVSCPKYFRHPCFAFKVIMSLEYEIQRPNVLTQ